MRLASRLARVSYREKNLKMSYAQIVIDPPAAVAPETPDHEESWKRCVSRLRAELGEDIFASWFGRLELEAVVNGRARFTVPTRFLKSWIESHYRDRILAALSSEIGVVVDLTLAVRSSTRTLNCAAVSAPVREFSRGATQREETHPTPLRETAPTVHAPARRGPESIALQEALSGSPLDRRLTFSTFLVGRSNQLAYSAAQRVSETKPDTRPPSVRFISTQRSASAKPIFCRRSPIQRRLRDGASSISPPKSSCMALSPR